MEYIDLTSWEDTSTPCLDPDSTSAQHQGNLSIGAFQTHSRFFYAPVHEACCGLYFVQLLYQQFHPFPQCADCARLTLGLASYICWQCRTYFRRYGTGMLKQIIGVTPQRHNIVEIYSPERGVDQVRLPNEDVAEELRDSYLEQLHQPILQRLLPGLIECTFWNQILPYLEMSSNSNDILAYPPTIEMPFFINEALLPLSTTPSDHITLFQSISDELNLDISQEEDISPPF